MPEISGSTELAALWRRVAPPPAVGQVPEIVGPASGHGERDAAHPMFAASAATSTIARRPRAGGPRQATFRAVRRRQFSTLSFATTSSPSSITPSRITRVDCLATSSRRFRDYLMCGVCAHGFLRLHCDDCRRDLLVAFSCQGRGICPSSAGRRMASRATDAAKAPRTGMSKATRRAMMQSEGEARGGREPAADPRTPRRGGDQASVNAARSFRVSRRPPCPPRGSPARTR